METKVAAEWHLQGDEKKKVIISSFQFQEEEGEEAMAAAAAAAASPAAAAAFSFLQRPVSLLRHVASGAAGYLNLSHLRRHPSSPAGAAAADAGENVDGHEAAAAAAVAEVRSRGAALPSPPLPRGMVQGSGGNGGRHHKA